MALAMEILDETQRIVDKVFLAIPQKVDSICNVMLVVVKPVKTTV